MDARIISTSQPTRFGDKKNHNALGEFELTILKTIATSRSVMSYASFMNKHYLPASRFS